MCTPACLDFIEKSILENDVRDRRVLEVGAQDVNGNCRVIIGKSQPNEYVGVDIASGPGVDTVCRAEDLVNHFGESSFDAVISTEMLEHVKDWRQVVSNLKRVVRPGGVILITTRSKGFNLHGYPYDFWRYEPEDLQVIFADFDIERLERDVPESPGVFMMARRRATSELDLSAYALYNVIRRRRSLEISPLEFRMMALVFRCWTGLENHLPLRLRSAVRTASHRWAGLTSTSATHV